LVFFSLGYYINCLYLFISSDNSIGTSFFGNGFLHFDRLHKVVSTQPYNPFCPLNCEHESLTGIDVLGLNPEIVPPSVFLQQVQSFVSPWLLQSSFVSQSASV